MRAPYAVLALLAGLSMTGCVSISGHFGSKIPGAGLLWVRADKIYYSTVSNFTEQVVTQGSYAETNPRWSPDGKQILFVRSSDGVYVMKSDFTGKTKVIPGGHTASWTRDGKSITAARNSFAWGALWVQRHATRPPYALMPL